MTANPEEIFAEYCISTHTLTWSVTDLYFPLNMGFIISTHTLTWSVTLGGYMDSAKEQISTHTLTWSVTDRGIMNANEIRFQLTRSRGA